MKKIMAFIVFLSISGTSFGQINPFDKVNFFLGEWKRTLDYKENF